MIPSAHPFRHPNLCTQRLAYALKSSGPDCNCFLDPDQVMFVLVGWGWTPESNYPDTHLPSLVRLAIREPNSQCGELRIEVTTHLRTESTTFLVFSEVDYTAVFVGISHTRLRLSITFSENPFPEFDLDVKAFV